MAPSPPEVWSSGGGNSAALDGTTGTFPGGTAPPHLLNLFYLTFPDHQKLQQQQQQQQQPSQQQTDNNRSTILHSVDNSQVGL